MRTLRARSLKGILVTLSTILVMAAAAVAGARGVFFLSPDSDEVTQESTEPECPPAEDGEGGEEGVLEEGAPEEGDPSGDCDPQEGEGFEEGEGSEDPGAEDPDGPANEIALVDREAACHEAAGLDEHPLPEDGRLRGLDNAISRVFENCMKNPQAPGLIVALERLAENRAKKEAREEAKAERRAEREARKGADEAEGSGRASRGDPPGLEKSSGGPPGHAGGPPGGGNGKGKGKGKGSGR
jgi:hypothetical protein